MYLFLDRDGVINERTQGLYVRNATEFILLPGVKEAITDLQTIFRRIFVVTNQAGINKGLFTHADMDAVHQHMCTLLPGLIDGVYYCPHRPDQNCNCRKPQPAMAWAAQFGYAQVRFADSWMVGDSASDMAFGKRLGMKTVQVGTKPEDADMFVGDAQPDMRFADLGEFARHMQEVMQSKASMT
jgi:histidinol-phosphate phosphatase family protein